MSCTLGRGQEERAVKASSARAEDKWVRRLLQRKNLGAEKLVQDLGPRGNLNLCFQLSPCSPTHPSPVLQHKLVEVLFWPHPSQQCLCPMPSILYRCKPLSQSFVPRGNWAGGKGRLEQGLSLRVSMQRPLSTFPPFP